MWFPLSCIEYCDPAAHGRIFTEVFGKPRRYWKIISNLLPFMCLMLLKLPKSVTVGTRRTMMVKKIWMRKKNLNTWYKFNTGGNLGWLPWSLRPSRCPMHGSFHSSKIENYTTVTESWGWQSSDKLYRLQNQLSSMCIVLCLSDWLSSTSKF